VNISTFCCISLMTLDDYNDVKTIEQTEDTQKCKFGLSESPGRVIRAVYSKASLA
jgi:hypothetical protein